MLVVSSVNVTSVSVSSVSVSIVVLLVLVLIPIEPKIGFGGANRLESRKADQNGPITS